MGTDTLSSQKNLLWGLISLRNGCIIGLIEYAQATWLTNPNQERALVKSEGGGKFSIADIIDGTSDS